MAPSIMVSLSEFPMSKLNLPVCYIYLLFTVSVLGLVKGNCRDIGNHLLIISVSH